MIVFLNKSDLFLEKLNKRGPITIRESFPDYPGDPYDYNDTTNYIQVWVDSIYVKWFKLVDVIDIISTGGFCKRKQKSWQGRLHSSDLCYQY